MAREEGHDIRLFQIQPDPFFNTRTSPEAGERYCGDHEGFEREEK
jgi:hypothetical protein